MIRRLGCALIIIACVAPLSRLGERTLPVTGPHAHLSYPGQGAPRWGLLVAAIAVVQGMLTTSFTVIAPTVPLVLPHLGVDDEAQLRAWTGAIIAMTPLAAAFTSPLWGNLADRIGRERIIMLCCLGNGTMAALMFMAEAPWHLLALRILMGSFSGFSAAGMALVAGAAPSDRLGYALGWLATGQLTGALLGPVAGGLIADLTGDPRTPFLFTLGMSSLAAVVVSIVAPHRTRVNSVAPRRHLLEDLGRVYRSPTLFPLFIALLLTQFSVRSVDPAVVLTAQRLLGDLPHVATLAGFAVSAAGLGNLVASPFLGRRSDVIGYRRVLLLSLLAAAAVTLPQAFAHDYWLFVTERFLAGAFIGGMLPTLNAMVGAAAGEGERAAVYGVTASAGFLGGFLGPLSGGFVAAGLGLPTVFVLASMVMLVTFCWVLAKAPPDTAPSPRRRR